MELNFYDRRFSPPRHFWLVEPFFPGTLTPHFSVAGTERPSAGVMGTSCGGSKTGVFFLSDPILHANPGWINLGSSDELIMQ